MKRLRRASPVVVFRTEAPPGRLIGHAWGSFDVADREDGWRRSESRTVCGRLLYAHEWREHHPGPGETRLDWRAGHSFLRLDVLQLVGRLCARCHPGDPPA